MDSESEEEEKIDRRAAMKIVGAMAFGMAGTQQQACDREERNHKELLKLRNPNSTPRQRAKAARAIRENNSECNLNTALIVGTSGLMMLEAANHKPPVPSDPSMENDPEEVKTTGRSR